MNDQNHNNLKKLTPSRRTVVEVAFILFLFYSNLLMGEFTASGKGQGKGMVWAINDIFTISNFIIGLVLGLIGHLIFEYFRRRA